MASALGDLVLPRGGSHGRNFVAVSRSWRGHALTSCYGNDGTHPEAASLVRRYGAGSCINKWTGRYASEVATTLQEDLASTLDRPWCATDAIHGIAFFGACLCCRASLLLEPPNHRQFSPRSSRIINDRAHKSAQTRTACFLAPPVSRNQNACSLSYIDRSDVGCRPARRGHQNRSPLDSH